MISFWSALYLVPLLIAFYLSFKLDNKECKIITSVALVAYVFTRLTTEFVMGDRYFFDLANDIFVVALIVRLLGLTPIVILLIITYMAMTYFAYIPYSEGIFNKHSSQIILEVIGKIQLLIIFGGLYHGHFIRNGVSFHNKLDDVVRDNSFYNNNIGEDKRKDGYDKPFKSGTHANMAKDS